MYLTAPVSLVVLISSLPLLLVLLLLLLLFDIFGVNETGESTMARTREKETGEITLPFVRACIVGGRERERMEKKESVSCNLHP